MTCKGCERNNQMMEMDIESAIDEQLSMELNHASNELRDQRLFVCSACPALSEHTCKHCGCFVRCRASLQDKRCPLGKW